MSELPSSLNLNANLQIEAAAAKDGDPASALPRFAMVAYTGVPMRIAGWKYPVVVDLAGMAIPSQSRPIRMGHDPSLGVGHTSSIQVAEGKLIASGVISRNTSVAQEIVASSKNGFPWQASIGASVEQHEFVGEGKSVIVNGRSFDGPVNVVRRSTLGEISFVDLGADGNTFASVAARKETSMSGGNNEVVNPSSDTNGGASGITTTGNQPGVVEKIRAEALAETKRIDAIRKVCGGAHSDIEAKAIGEGWDENKTKIAVLEANQAKRAPAVIGFARSSIDASAVLEVAASRSAGVYNEQAEMARHGENVLTEADRFRGIRLRRLAELCAAQSGVMLPMNEGSGEWMRAAFSNSNLPTILGNIANKALAQAFVAGNAVAPRISRPVSHSNFHAHTVCSMGLNGTLDVVAPDGELKSLRLSEETRTRQLQTRGALLSVTRQDVINDDLGAMANAAREMGRKAFNSRESAVFALLNGTGAGASFFTAGRGNYISGADTVLSINSLSAAIEKFMSQTDPSGEYINVMPRLLLVPPALKGVADEIFRSSNIVSGSTGKVPSANIHVGAYEPLTSPYLTSGSTTAWYLLADPADLAVVDIAYLSGNEMPVVEAFGLDSNPGTLGYTWRVYYDFGAALAEYRAGVKSKGAA